MSVALALLAMLIEAVVGYPDRLVHAIGHPVIWIGDLIAALERRLNRDCKVADIVVSRSGDDAVTSPLEGEVGRRSRPGGGYSVKDVTPLTPLPDPSPQGGTECCGDNPRIVLARLPGIIALIILLLVVGALATALQYALALVPVGLVLLALIASSLIAQRSLHNHVARVASALEAGGLDAGRAAVSQIVGRDPASLDEAGVARAAIESLAENFSDGVVAPVFWLVLGGLPGAAVYKAVNTADSMIGHRTPRYAHFGWAAARLDDLLNLPASRLSALLLIAAAALTSRKTAAQAWTVVRRDAAHHRSPNAGYPEAAMAGALALKLAGPRVYAGVCVEDAFMGDGRREATAADIRAALTLYRRADALLVALLAVIAVMLIALA
jgi:adenosylcobinamide-phosphate synthase